MNSFIPTSFNDVKVFVSDKHHLNYLREKSFSKHFKSLYECILKLDFPNTFTFTQKLYHFFNKDPHMLLGICQCGNRCVFKSFYEGYTQYCSPQCGYSDPNRTQRIIDTNIKRYGVKMSSMLPEYVEKQKETLKEKTGYEFPMQNPENKKKSIETNLKLRGVEYSTQDENVKKKIRDKKMERYGDESFNNHTKTSLTKEERYGDINYNNIKQMKETCILRYGVDSYSKTDMFKSSLQEINGDRVRKIFETKKKNHTSNTSNIEEQFEKYLTDKDYAFIRNYRSPKYPFHCDFYISDFDIYVEIQGFWTHGKHPFDKNNEDDIEILKTWESKDTPQYKKAVHNWTIQDPLKRQTAKENNLNYLEIFSDKIDVVIEEFEKYLK